MHRRRNYTFNGSVFAHSTVQGLISRIEEVLIYIFTKSSYRGLTDWMASGSKMQFIKHANRISMRKLACNTKQHLFL